MFVEEMASSGELKPVQGYDKSQMTTAFFENSLDPLVRPPLEVHLHELAEGRTWRAPYEPIGLLLHDGLFGLAAVTGFCEVPRLS